MTRIESSVDQQEIAKFAQHSNDWWNKEGPLRTLHDINGTRLEFISQHIQLKNSRVLDVGCGGGILAEAMANKGAEVLGIDAEVEAINTAIEHAKQSKISLDYYCTPIEDLETETFDALTCMEMLEHIQHPELILKHCKRLLKPGGMLFLSTINRTLKAYLGAVVTAEYILNLLPKQTHDYAKFIKPSELMSIARAIGFNLVDLQGMDYNPISRKASLGTDVSINYLLALQFNGEKISRS